MSCYEKNRLALAQYHPELEELLKQEIPTDHIRVIRAGSGASRLLIRLENGDVVAVHNAEDPVGVAVKTAEKLQETSGGVLVMMGMGLGYLARELAIRLGENEALLFYEADAGIFKTAMQENDLTPVFCSNRIKVVVGPESKLEGWCHQFMLQVGGAVRVSRFEPAFRLNSILYETKWEKELLGFTQAMAMNFATVGQLGPLFSRSILEAIPHILYSYGVNQLEGKFKGCPAILVAAGPSLEKNVHYLKDAKGKAVIICADTVLGYLLARDIVPDFVVSVDPQGTTYSKYQGVEIPKEIALVFHPACNDKIFKHFPGPKFVTKTQMVIYHWLEELLPEKGTLEGNIQCQMHMGFNLARLVGCNPIIIVGQDLCYTDSLMHVRGGSYLKESDEANLVNQGILTRNMFGDSVKTYPVFWGYKKTFEQKIEEFPGTVLNATEGGLSIRGAENVRLTDVLTSFYSSQRVDVLKTIKGIDKNRIFIDWPKLLQEIRDRVKDFHRIERVSRRIIGLLQEIADEQKKGRGISPRLVDLTHKAERLTSCIPQYAKALGLLQMVDFGLELYMMREATEKIDLVEDEEERLQQQIERGRRYYGALLRVAPPMKNSLYHLLQRIEALQNLEERSRTESRPMGKAEAAKIYADIEMFDRAAEFFLENGIPLSRDEAILSLHVLMHVNDLQGSVDQADLARRNFPEDVEIQALWDQAHHLKREWQNRKKAAKNVLDRSSKLADSPFAGGDFYFRLHRYGRAIEQYRKAIDENPSSCGEGWYRLAKVFQAQKNEHEALEALHYAMNVNPGDARVYFDLGVMALERRQLDVAERFFLKGAEITLDDPEYCEAVGVVLCAAGETAKAIHFYERSLAQFPEHPDLLRGIAQAYQSLFAPASNV